MLQPWGTALAVTGGAVVALLLAVTPPIPVGGVASDPVPVRSGLENLPPAARGPVSSALGRDDPRYHVRALPNRLEATNGPHALDLSFTTQGVQVRSLGGSLGLKLRAVGHGNVLAPVGAPAPRSRENRVEYHHHGVREWYVNGPLGLEQGFTVDSRPAGAGSSPLTLKLGLDGNLAASLTGDARGLDLRRDGVSLRYVGLVASDARGRDLRAWLELRDRQILVRVDDSAARYPLTIDPFVQQAKVTAPDGAAEDRFGYTVAAAGDTIAVGAPFAHVAAEGDARGAAYVFVKPSTGWANATVTAKLTGSDSGVGDRMGTSLSMSGDAIVAGAPFHDLHPYVGDQGAAYVFVKPSGGWTDATETAKLTASADMRGAFGESTAISGDTVVVGDRGVDIDAMNQGAVYVFTKPAGGWVNATETARLTASDGAVNDELGIDVAASGDTVVAGTIADDDWRGATYVFERPASGWESGNETAKLTASDRSQYDSLGYSVAIHGDTVVAGSPGDDLSGQGQGSAYVFAKPSGGWATTTETAKLTASDGEYDDSLGRSVAVEGDRVVAGAPFDDIGPGHGSVYVFDRPAGGWVNATQTAKLTAADGMGEDTFGFAIDLSGDTLVAGAFADNVGGNPSQGSAYVFEFVPNRPPDCGTVAAAPAALEPTTRTQMDTVTLQGGSDPDGDALSFHIDGVTQDEPVSDAGGRSSLTPDAGLTAAGADSNQVMVRGERSPTGNGRVYRIAYTLADGRGGRCSGTAGVSGTTGAKVSVARRKDETPIDDGDSASWDSMLGTPVSGTLP